MNKIISMSQKEDMAVFQADFMKGFNGNDKIKYIDSCEDIFQVFDDLKRYVRPVKKTPSVRCKEIGTIDKSDGDYLGITDFDDIFKEANPMTIKEQLAEELLIKGER